MQANQLWIVGPIKPQSESGGSYLEYLYGNMIEELVYQQRWNESDPLDIIIYSPGTAGIPGQSSLANVPRLQPSSPLRVMRF